MLRAPVLVALFCCVAAELFELASHELPYGTPTLERVVGMYTLADSPATAKHVTQNQDRDSFIKIDVKVTTATSNPGFVEVVIIQANSIEMIGYSKGDELQYCCDSRLMDMGVAGCTEINGLIVKESEDIDVQRYKVEFTADSSKQDLSVEYAIRRTGEHLLISSNCDSNLGKVEFEGISEWVNPYGYLPGSSYGFLPFYSAMAIIYLIVCLLWFCLNLCNWREILRVQYFITGVVGMCMLEMTVWYFDYSNLNTTGVRHVGAAVFGILVSCSRRTLSRMLIVSVSLGYGVVKPTLGNNKLKLLCLGAIYFVAETSLEIVIRYAQTNEVGERWRVTLSIPMSITNAIFYWWTFVVLSETKTYLKERNQAVKLALYVRFTRVLVLSVFAAVIFAFYQIWFVSTEQMKTNWSERYLFDGAMEMILFTIILLAIMFLWRPTANNQRYAYSQVASDGMDDLDGLEQIQMNNLATPKFDLSSDDDDDIPLSSDEDGDVKVGVNSSKLE